MARCKVFGVYDCVAETFLTVGLSSTAGCFAREIGKLLVRQNPDFESETKIVELMDIDEENALKVCDGFIYDWDVYKKPEAPAVPMENKDLQFAPINSNDKGV